jgi:hypothetical protein
MGTKGLVLGIKGVASWVARGQILQANWAGRRDQRGGHVALGTVTTLNMIDGVVWYFVSLW